MDMTIDEFKYLTSTCWNEQYQPLTNDMTKDKFTGRCRLGLNSIFVPDYSPFYELNTYKDIYIYTRDICIIIWVFMYTH